MPCFPLDGRPAHHHNTVFFFFFLFHNIFISPSSAARKTPTVHISAAQQSSALLYTRNVQCDKNFTRRKGFTQTEFHAMNLPMRTCFTTLKITFLQNCENIFKKKKIVQAFSPAGIRKYTEKEKSMSQHHRPPAWTQTRRNVEY